MGAEPERRGVAPPLSGGKPIWKVTYRNEKAAHWGNECRESLGTRTSCFS